MMMPRPVPRPGLYISIYTGLAEVRAGSNNTEMSYIIRSKKYLEAIEFYNRSLERVKDIGTISNLLLSVGTVALKIDSSIE